MNWRRRYVPICCSILRTDVTEGIRWERISRTWSLIEDIWARATALSATSRRVRKPNARRSFVRIEWAGDEA